MRRRGCGGGGVVEIIQPILTCFLSGGTHRRILQREIVLLPSRFPSPRAPSRPPSARPRALSVSFSRRARTRSSIRERERECLPRSHFTDREKVFSHRAKPVQVANTFYKKKNKKQKFLTFLSLPEHAGSHDGRLGEVKQ